ncbi:MAG: hypothetical protein KAY37_08630 [Phycisphaerae bacterium]|nr:hypothetical protein [Phycisphaerae bacterium]
MGLEQPPDATPDSFPAVVRIDVFLLCSTVSPEKNIDPSVKHEHFFKQLQFLTLLRDFNDPDQAYKFGRAFMKEIWDDGPALNRLAWAALTEEGLEKRALRFVEKAAGRANELTESRDAECLNTLARLHYERDDLPAALKWARQAVEHLAGLPPYVAEPIQEALKRYEARSEKD